MIKYLSCAIFFAFSLCNAAQQAKNCLFSPRMTNTVKILVQKRKALEVAFIDSLCKKNFNVAKEILTTGAVSVNLRRDEHHYVNDGATPLMIFSMGRISKKTVEWLLNNGADVFLENQGKDIYYYANIDMRTWGLTFFIKYMSTVAKAQFHFLLANFAGVEVKDLANIIFAYAYTPSTETLNQALLRAAGWCHFDEVQYLLAQGANCNTQDNDTDKKQTPLMKAIRFGLCPMESEDTINTIKELLKYNPDLTMCDTEGKTAEYYVKDRLFIDNTFKNKILKCFEEHKQRMQEAEQKI